VLEAIRGTSEVDAEYGTIINAYRRGMVAGENQLTTVMRREYRPHVAMSILCPLFQQWTGINSVICEGAPPPPNPSAPLSPTLFVSVPLFLALCRVDPEIWFSFHPACRLLLHAKLGDHPSRILLQRTINLAELAPKANDTWPWPVTNSAILCPHCHKSRGPLPVFSKSLPPCPSSLHLA